MAQFLSFSQPHAPEQTAVLLSRRPIWVRDAASLRHRHFSSITSNRTLFDAKPAGGAKWWWSDTPRSPPCSWRACSIRRNAAREPSRHMSLSELRGTITGNRAWSALRRHRRDIVLPVFLVCIIPLPLARTSLTWSSRQSAVDEMSPIMSSRGSPAAAWPHSQQPFQALRLARFSDFVIAPHSFKPPQPAPGWRVGGRSGPTIPSAEAGRTRRAATQWRTRASPGLRHAAAGSQGSDAHPPDRVPEAKRRRARAATTAISAQRCPDSRGSPSQQHSRSRLAVAAACARACGPAAAAPSGRIECARRHKDGATSGAPPEQASVRSIDLRDPFQPAPAGPASCDRHPHGPRRTATRRRDSRRRARSRSA
jgi:hypothetical protein